MKKLAINGGKKVRNKLFPMYKVIDDKEIKAVTKVLKSGILSRFLGAWHLDFYGGPEVQKCEKAWAKMFGAKYAISVNSATSGLIAALGAVGVKEGDEVIVTPYSMSISATAPLFYGAIPVFADVEPDYFCLDPKDVEKKITKKTKAIIVVDLFGQPYDADKINKIAKKHKIVVIEDTAQAPLARYKNKYAGTLGDIGVFSLNYHKHIHSGEGGIIVTNNKRYAERMQLIRNHAEAVVGPKKVTDLQNMVGFNFRMTEIEATITNQQIKKLKTLLQKRIKNVDFLAKELSSIKFLNFSKVRPNTSHAFYVHPFLFDEKKAGISRDVFIDAVKAELMPTENRVGEGVKIVSGYTRPLYELPVFQSLEFVGRKGDKKLMSKYKKVTCPVVADLHYNKLAFHELMHANMTKTDLLDVVKAFKKVAENIDELKK
ncbi:DegT/DnrJ/EryC1/StrS family aminotransferase [Candidatus Nomurabacteria bacterium]|nr:DegT/DnrJ/EryC1/StrS family aminotransferase [Candidatus Nomurabacteria bacterium]